VTEYSKWRTRESGKAGEPELERRAIQGMHHNGMHRATLIQRVLEFGSTTVLCFAGFKPVATSV
jgi:hypothetical protein